MNSQCPCTKGSPPLQGLGTPQRLHYRGRGGRWGSQDRAAQSVNQLQDTFEKVARFNRILAEPPERPLSFASAEDHRRFVYRRPYFAFFFESKVRLETILARLRDWDSELRAVDRPSIDAVFLIGPGVRDPLRRCGRPAQNPFAGWNGWSRLPHTWGRPGHGASRLSAVAVHIHATNSVLEPPSSNTCFKRMPAAS